MIGILLQQDIQFFARPDPAQTRTTVIVFALLVLLAVGAALVSGRKGGMRGGRTMGLVGLARRYGLDAEQRRMLRELVRSLSLRNPQRLLTNGPYLNHALRRRFEQLDLAGMPDSERERKKSVLFSLKRTIENATANVTMLASTRRIRIGQPVHVSTMEGVEHDTQVASNVHNGLGIEMPYERRGLRQRHRKGSSLQISLVDGEDRLYSFKTRVLGYSNMHGASVMFVEHAANIRQTQKRRSPRRDYDRPCYFYPVTVLTTGRGRRQKTQAFVNKNRRIFGRFENLSAGGCAVRTQIPLSRGSILRIDFDICDGTRISVFGMVRAVDHQRTRGRLMHIKFTRVSRKHLNQIQSYVYGLTEQS